MEQIQYILIGLGIFLVIVGLVWGLGSKFGLGSLPGDIKIENKNFKFYFPLATSIIISIVLSLIFLIIQKLKI